MIWWIVYEPCNSGKYIFYGFDTTILLFYLLAIQVRSFRTKFDMFFIVIIILNNFLDFVLSKQ